MRRTATDTVFVAEQSVVWQRPSRQAWPHVKRQVAALPPGLADSLAARAAEALSTRHWPLPAAVRWVSALESDQVQARGLGGSAVYGLSRVAFTLDSLHALVYVERRCGAMCGHGAAIWLSRLPDSHVWTQRGEVWAWSS